jgi:hypothetical protein
LPRACGSPAGPQRRSRWRRSRLRRWCCVERSRAVDPSLVVNAAAAAAGSHTRTLIRLSTSL